MISRGRHLGLLAVALLARQSGPVVINVSDDIDTDERPRRPVALAAEPTVPRPLTGQDKRHMAAAQAKRDRRAAKAIQRIRGDAQ